MSQPKQPNKWLQLITIPFQMGFIIFIFHYIGEYLDTKNNTAYYNNIFVILGVFLSLYYVIRQIERINKNNEN